MLTAKDLKEKKKKNEKISMITAYDFAFAHIAETAGIDQILVGDSLANTMLGYKSTRDIGMTEMIIFTRAVCKGAPNTHVVGDMPYLSYKDPETALENAKRFMDVGASSVKLEGAKIDVIEKLLSNNIDVMGHLGLLPQTAKSFKQCGKTEEAALQLQKEAQEIDQLGLYSFVLEHIPEELGYKITKQVKAVTIGCGAGNKTDGRVLVLHDVLGMSDKKNPPFAHKYANIFEAGVNGIKDYIRAVKEE